MERSKTRDSCAFLSQIAFLPAFLPFFLAFCPTSSAALLISCFLVTQLIALAFAPCLALAAEVPTANAHVLSVVTSMDPVLNMLATKGPHNIMADHSASESRQMDTEQDTDSNDEPFEQVAAGAVPGTASPTLSQLQPLSTTQTEQQRFAFNLTDASTQDVMLQCLNSVDERISSSRRIVPIVPASMFTTSPGALSNTSVNDTQAVSHAVAAGQSAGRDVAHGSLLSASTGADISAGFASVQPDHTNMRQHMTAEILPTAKATTDAPDGSISPENTALETSTDMHALLTRLCQMWERKQQQVAVCDSEERLVAANTELIQKVAQLDNAGADEAAYLKLREDSAFAAYAERIERIIRPVVAKRMLSKAQRKKYSKQAWLLLLPSPSAGDGQAVAFHRWLRTVRHKPIIAVKDAVKFRDRFSDVFNKLRCKAKSYATVKAQLEAANNVLQAGKKPSSGAISLSDTCTTALAARLAPLLQELRSLCKADEATETESQEMPQTELQKTTAVLQNVGNHCKPKKAKMTKKATKAELTPQATTAEPTTKALELLSALRCSRELRKRFNAVAEINPSTLAAAVRSKEMKPLYDICRDRTRDSVLADAFEQVPELFLLSGTKDLVSHARRDWDEPYSSVLGNGTVYDALNGTPQVKAKDGTVRVKGSSGWRRDFHESLRKVPVTTEMRVLTARIHALAGDPEGVARSMVTARANCAPHDADAQANCTLDNVAEGAGDQHSVAQGNAAMEGKPVTVPSVYEDNALDSSLFAEQLLLSPGIDFAAIVFNGTDDILDIMDTDGDAENRSTPEPSAVSSAARAFCVDDGIDVRIDCQDDSAMQICMGNGDENEIDYASRIYPVAATPAVCSDAEGKCCFKGSDKACTSYAAPCEACLVQYPVTVLPPSDDGSSPSNADEGSRSCKRVDSAFNPDGDTPTPTPTIYALFSYCVVWKGYAECTWDALCEGCIKYLGGGVPSLSDQDSSASELDELATVLMEQPEFNDSGITERPEGECCDSVGGLACSLCSSLRVDAAVTVDATATSACATLCSLPSAVDNSGQQARQLQPLALAKTRTRRTRRIPQRYCE